MKTSRIPIHVWPILPGLFLCAIGSWAQPLVLQDIGSPAIGGTSSAAAGGYDLTAGGRDIGGTSDQFTFEYEQRSGDFDVKMRLAALSSSDVWAKAGLMAREFLTSTSRFAAVL